MSLSVKKVSKIFFLVLTCTMILYVFKSGIDSQSKRELITQAQVNEICNGINLTSLFPSYVSDLSGFLANQTTSLVNSQQFLADLGKPSSQGIQILIGIFKAVFGNSAINQEEVFTYAKTRGAPYITFIFFACVSIIAFIVFAACLCCPTSCCKREDNIYKEREHACCRVSSFVITLVFQLGMIICCCIGFAFAQDFLVKANSVTCNLIQFMYDAQQGQNSTIVPRWVGLNGVVKLIDDTLTQIDYIKSNATTTLAKTNDPWTTTDPNALNTALTGIYTKYKDSKLDSLDPKSANKISPIYIENLGPTDTTNKVLNTEYLELKNVLEAIIASLKQIGSYSDKITQYADEIKNKIQEQRTYVQSLVDKFNSLETTIVTPWVSNQAKVTPIGSLAINIFFGVLIIVVSVLFIFLFIFVCCYKNCQCIRCFMYIFVYFLCVIMVLTFVLGAAVGIIGLMGSDGSGVLRYLFSEQNLTKDQVMFSGQTAVVLNTCFNKDGDLATALGLNTGNAGALKQLTDAIYALNQLTKNSTFLQSSQAVLITNTYLDGMNNNIKLTFDVSKTDSPTIQFGEWQKYTDSSISGTFQTSCATKTKDQWVQSKDLCGTGYTYLAATDSDKLGNPNCIVISEFSAKYKTRYPSCSVPNYGTVSDANVAYYDRFNKYIGDNKDLITKVKADLSTYSTSYGQTGQKALNTATDIKKVMDPVANIISGGASGGFSNLINCKIFQTDTNILLYNMQNNVAPISLNLAIILGIISFFNGIALTFLLPVLLRCTFTQEDADEERRQEAKQTVPPPEAAKQ